MNFNAMFKGLWTLIFVPVAMLANITMGVIFPPKKLSSQVEKPTVKPTYDSSMSLAEARDIFSTAIDNKSRVNKLVENKKEIKPKVIIKEVPVPVYRDKPVYKTIYKDTIYVSNGIGVEKPLVIYKDAPKYGGDSVQNQLSFLSSKKKKSGISKFFNSIFAKNKYKYDKTQDTTSKLKNETQLEHKEDSLGFNNN